MKCVIIKHARKIVTAASSTWGRKMSCQLFKKRKKSMFYLYIRLLLKYTYMRLINKCRIYLENCTILLLWNVTSKLTASVNVFIFSKIIFWLPQQRLHWWHSSIQGEFINELHDAPFSEIAGEFFNQFSKFICSYMVTTSVTI